MNQENLKTDWDRYLERDKTKGLLGLTFGRLTVVDFIGKIEGQTGKWWLCECGCGVLKPIRGNAITTPNQPTRSCGCLHRESALTANSTHGHSSDYSPNQYIYRLWTNIHRKCNNPTDRAYRNYGGRGITVFKDWQSIDKFCDYIINILGHRPSPEYSIDRIDNDGNYEPDNLRWATRSQQNNNRRCSVRLEESAA